MSCALRIVLCLLLLAVPAWAAADPVTIVTAIGYALVYGGATFVGYAVIVAAVVYGSIEARQKARAAAARARNAYNASLADRSITALTAEPPLRYVYGQCVTGGDVVAMFTSDKTGTKASGSTYTKPDGLKHLVVTFASHQCKALNELFIDGQAVGLASLDGSGWSTVTPFADFRDAFREINIAAGGNAVFPSAVTVSSAVDATSGGGDQGPTPASYTQSGDLKTVFNPNAFVITVSLTFTEAVSSVRVSWHLGDDNQAADAYLLSVTGGTWASSDQLLGLAYAVVTLDLENSRFQGGPPGITFDISGKRCYDPRTNGAPVQLWTGAVAGTPGTLPTNTAIGLAAGLSRSVVGQGTDSVTGLEYVDLRLFGTASATGSTTYALQTAAVAPGTAPGTNWGARVGVRILAIGGNAFSAFRLQLLSYASGGAVTVENTGANITQTTAAGLQWPTAAAVLASGAAIGAGQRLQISVVSGQFYDCTFRLLLPQLWYGVLDGSTDPTRYTQNPAIVIRDFLMSPDGYGVNMVDINDSSVVVAANDCDASISFHFKVLSIDTYVNGPTYTVNGAFTTDQGRDQVLQDLCESMAGFAVPGAAWSLQAGAWHAPVLDLVDDDLNGQIEIIQAGAALEDIFNGIRGTFIPTGSAVVTDLDPPYQNTTFVAADGEELWQDSAYPYTGDGARARNLARVFVERGRAGQIIRYPAKMKAWPLEVGDRVTVTSAEYGFAAKTYRVTDWNYSPGGKVILVLQEDAASIYDQADAAVADPTPNTNLPDPWVVDPVTSVTAASGDANMLRQDDGSIIIRCKVGWTPPTSNMAGGGRIELAWRRALQDPANLWRIINSPGDATGEYITGVADAQVINIALTAVNSLGARSKTVYLTHTVAGKLVPPADVTGLVGAELYGGVQILWVDCPDSDYAFTELRIGASWGAGTPLTGTTPTRVRGNGYFWPWPAFGTYNVMARHVDRIGNYSTNTVSTTVVVDANMLIPTGGLGSGAATEAGVVQVASATITKVKHTPDGYTFNDLIASFAITPSVSCQLVVTVTASFDYLCDPSFDDVGVYHSLQSGTWDGFQVRDSYEHATLVGGHVSRSLSLTRILSVTAGTPYTVGYYACKSRAGDTVSMLNTEIVWQLLKR